MKKTLIIQANVPEYRVPFFNALNKKLDGNLVIASGVENQKLNCQQYQMKVLNICGFVYCQHLPNPENFSRIIMIFDLRWLLLYPLLLLNRQKVILWGHGLGRSKLLSGLRGKLVNISCGFLSYEQKGMQDFINYGISEAKLAYMGNTQEVTNHCLTEGAKNSFIYVGRLQERKGLTEIIQAFSLLPSGIKHQLSLIFVGSGSEKQKLSIEAEKYGVTDQCEFISATYNAVELKSLFSKSLAYISPDHVGLGVLNAFAYGVPVITHKDRAHAPEITNVRDGINGFLTDGTVEGLAAAMGEYATDNQTARIHAKNAYERYVKCRTMEMMVERFYKAITGFVE